MTRWFTIALAVLVIGLGLSWAYAAFWPKREPERHPVSHRVIRVQVLNGSGEDGVGGRVASFLRAGGYHVVEVGNADRSDFFPTLVVSRRADGEAARAVARYLGGPPIVQQAWSSDLAEVTVVVGRDRSRLRLED